MKESRVKLTFCLCFWSAGGASVSHPIGPNAVFVSIAMHFLSALVGFCAMSVHACSVHDSVQLPSIHALPLTDSKNLYSTFRSTLFKTSTQERNMKQLLFCVWIISLNIILSRSIHFNTEYRIPSFPNGQTILCCVCIPHFSLFGHLLMDGYANSLA